MRGLGKCVKVSETAQAVSVKKYLKMTVKGKISEIAKIN